MPFLDLSQVTKSFGASQVIKGVSLTAEKGEFIVFVGPSGCGKSTLLRMISGLEEVSGGVIAIDGRDVTYVAPADREVAMVFQSYALYPHMSVYDNIAFGLRLKGKSESEIRSEVDKAARILQISELLERKPRQLSGGQRQRVAIGRAIVRNPKLFLFDEPLSNLDAELRTQMRVEIAKLHRGLGVTMVYVTHDQIEAMTLADRIVVLRSGVIEQVGTPTELYDSPANSFVAGFIGSPKMNFIAGKVEAVSDGKALVSNPALVGGRLSIPINGNASAGQTVSIGLRPENLAIGAGNPVLQVTADFTEQLGGSSLVYGKTSTGDIIAAAQPNRVAPQMGDSLTLGLLSGRVYLFDEAGKAM